MNPCVRFDDHTPGRERSFALRGMERTVIARRVDDVLPALAEVEHAVASGRFAGGYVAYEAAPAFDRALKVRAVDPDGPFGHLPLVWFGIFERKEELDPFAPRLEPAPYRVSAWRAEIGRSDYDDAVATIRRRIAAGDTYQVNHTFRLRAAFSGDPNEFYRDIVLAQRSAYSASFDTGRYQVLSASPERFFRMDGGRTGPGRIQVRPMKGTIRRGRWPGEDDELAARLLTSEKDRAENLMIVDLLRNDLGRVAEFGTVHVDHLLALERFETLWQLTSSISAETRSGVGLTDLMTALFPSGSVTGAPKAATMDIIRSLEASPRGVYCGALGYLSPEADGAVTDFSVGIRTVVIDAVEGLAEYGTGGGITWDSIAASEFEEARLKAQLLVVRRPEFDLLETIRWDPDEGHRLYDEHIERLTRSGVYFGYPVDVDVVREQLDKAVAGSATSQRVRLVVGRDGSVHASAMPFDEAFATSYEDAPSLTVSVSDTPVSTDDVFLFHKTTNRTAYDWRLSAHPSVDDVILVNERGEVTESTIGNVVVLFGDQWWTPPVESGCLPGTYRAALIAAGVLRERAITPNELEGAQVAIVNGVRGWRRVVMID